MIKPSNRTLTIIAAITSVAAIVAATATFMFTRQQMGTAYSKPQITDSCITYPSEEYIGLSESQAIQKAKSIQQPYIIATRDEKDFIHNTIKVPCRITLTIKNDTVTEAKTE